MTSKARADLTGVSETALLTLHSRAREAQRPDTILSDPVAVDLLASIDYDFTRFGNPRQDMAIRSKTFDRQTREYLQDFPKATVVALAEGLQTSFWRLDTAIDDPQFRWLTVDLPPIVELRRALLPASDRVELCAQSALDYSWMDRVDTDNGAFVTAEGLLMYLQPEQSMALITECAKRFRGGRLMFDLAPRWFTGLANRGWLRPTRRYTLPGMPFTLSPAEVARLVDVPGVRVVREIPAELGRGLFGGFAGALSRSHSILDPVRPLTVLLEFA
ncbi:class I SAM-dependent methyltransferase [Mycolicibacterium brumae]|uniref:Class I SAM-dependent methyltransferase n=1 Tax=Mycolicibacterium brumae TaxID=85968 RepID=A0A2G5PEK8_9MYCO|nr:class I SAM-dependent methyltransferase [Mycolicibacterium brumae]MCV7192046.1 class I SAM-dependent methyltransferase [Mycolicibacterium brumae]PIB76751.1 class I SAM-dependent methyltransferase [Mycolicibacterium brumae]RWA20713.1 hypothetical protein MBRU_03375 [Mycolicibacterium brumae DSM 44177]UWW07811.1 class I SAM-dependent methyltransferase [Mycolicibacterium brumae]